ncbi:ribose-5-phosphate isomerase, partial [bacterium]
AESARRHNNSNVLVMGASLNTPDEMKNMVDIWLRTPFEGGRHERRINKIKCLENEN